MTFHRIVLSMLAALLLGFTPALAQESRRIVAIGDLHGDYAAYLDIVEAAGLADAKAHWTGGNAVLVQMGDVPDRGADSLKIIQHLRKLQKDAKKRGGEVIVLVGNHEAMNITGDLRYVSPGEYDAFRTPNSAAVLDRLFDLNKTAIVAFYRRADPALPESEAKARWLAANPPGKYEHRVAWSPKGEVGQWIIGHPAIVKLGDTLFVHGGLSVETAAHPLAQVNDEVTAELAKGESNADSILTDPLGPLWYRGNVMRSAARHEDVDSDDTAPPASAAAEPPADVRPSIADELTQVLAAYGAQRLVVAHTPHLQGIVASQNGRLIRVDTGISAYYGGVRSYLEISGEQTRAWQEGKDGKWSSYALPQPGDVSAPSGSAP